ncbi:MAG: ABC transporter permease, partial [Planctomycetes bacterium]|nr:ABC transporter permease [Planctomycetota bacterium]
VLMAFVLGAVFRMPMREFAPYVFSGVLVWEFLSGSTIAGCACFAGVAPYIRQRKLPMAIYPLKMVIARFVILMVGMVGLAAWALWIKPANISLPLVSLIVALPLLGLLAWPLTIISAFINVKFRDFEHCVGLLLQALWYISPVFLRHEQFRVARLGALLDYNPVTHVLNLVRAPILHGRFPSGVDYLYVCSTILVFWIIAAVQIKTEESRVIFYT